VSKRKDSKHLKPRKHTRAPVINSLERIRKRLAVLRARCELDLGEVGAGVAIRDAQWSVEQALDSLRARVSGHKARHRKGASMGKSA
jgi:hypothetical protein